jgi:hypothetical protein
MYLPPGVYETVEKAVCDADKKVLNEQLCLKGKFDRQLSANITDKQLKMFPTFKLRLTDEEPPVYLTITPEMYLPQDEFGTRVVVIKPGEHFILGAPALVGSTFLFDRDSKRLGIAPTEDCSEFFSS